MKIQEQKLCDFVVKFPQLLALIKRLGIDFGFGDATIEAVCEQKGINTLFFCDLLQLLMHKYQFNPNYIHNFDPKLTVEYLKNSHVSYFDEYLIQIEECIIDLKRNELGREKDTAILHKYFLEYKDEFVTHLYFEDNKIFPYILNLANYAKSDSISEETINNIKNNSIDEYLKDHDSLNEKLTDLKYLLIKYFKPFTEVATILNLLKLIFDLEEDLRYHELIEDHILFPQVKKMEIELFNRFENGNAKNN